MSLKDNYFKRKKRINDETIEEEKKESFIPGRSTKSGISRASSKSYGSHMYTNSNSTSAFFSDSKVNTKETNQMLDYYLGDKFDVLVKNIIFDSEDPVYSRVEYIKGLPSDLASLNSVDLRISKMKFDKYYFAPNFHRISSLRVCESQEASMWSLLANLVISYKCINFPLVYYTAQIGTTDRYNVYFERIDHKNILNCISNKDIIFQVAFVFYYMFKNRIWTQTPRFDMIDIGKTRLIFKINNIGFNYDLNRIVVLSPECKLETLMLNESVYLNTFLSLIRKEYNYKLNRPYYSFVEFFLFEYYEQLVAQVTIPLRHRSNEITSPSLISSFHSPGTFVQFKFYEKIFTGILLNRLDNTIGENFNNCIIAYFNETIDIALVNESDVYVTNGPLISFLGLTIGE